MILSLIIVAFFAVVLILALMPESKIKYNDRKDDIINGKHYYRYPKK